MEFTFLVLTWAGLLLPELTCYSLVHKHRGTSTLSTQDHGWGPHFLIHDLSPDWAVIFLHILILGSTRKGPDSHSPFPTQMAFPSGSGFCCEAWTWYTTDRAWWCVAAESKWRSLGNVGDLTLPYAGHCTPWPLRSFPVPIPQRDVKNRDNPIGVLGFCRKAEDLNNLLRVLFFFSIFNF